METEQQNGRFTLFSTKFHSNIYSILFGQNTLYARSVKYRNKVPLLSITAFVSIARI